MDFAAFVETLRQQFPDIAEELDDEDLRGLMYLKTHVFTRYTQSAINRGDETLVRRCFQVADQAAVQGDDHVQNAIGVAFLEDLNLQDGKVRREWAFDLLPERLRADAASLGISPGYRKS